MAPREANGRRRRSWRRASSTCSRRTRPGARCTGPTATPSRGRAGRARRSSSTPTGRRRSRAGGPDDRRVGTTAQWRPEQGAHRAPRARRAGRDARCRPARGRGLARAAGRAAVRRGGPRGSDMAEEPYEISPRVALQAATRPYRFRERGAPLVRPLRIYTLDPSVSRRVGGIATVEVPYEPLEEGPKGALFEIDPAGAPEPLAARPLDLDDHYLLMSAGLAPSPVDARFHLQMVYAVCSLTYAAFRRAVGRDVAWACGVPAGPDGALRLRVRPFAFEDDNAAYDRADSGLSFGYFRAGRRPARPHGSERPDVHVPLARRHRPRDDARPPRRAARPLLRARRPRRPRVPRGVRGPRRAPPPLHATRTCSRRRSRRAGAP